jgi:hypothetical protein
MASEQPLFRVMSNLRTPRLRVLEVCGIKAGRASGKRAKTPAIAIVSLGRKPRSQTIGIIVAGLAASSLTPSACGGQSRACLA